MSEQSTETLRRPSQPPPPPPPPASHSHRRASESSKDGYANEKVVPQEQSLELSLRSSFKVEDTSTLKNEGNPFTEDEGEEDFDEDRKNSLDDSDAEDDDGFDQRTDHGSVVTIQSMNSEVNQSIRANAASRLNSLRMRSIDTQRAKNTLDQFESDGEFELDDFDEMFTRRSSVTRASFISASNPVLGSDGTATSNPKLLSSSSSATKDSAAPIIINSYGIRVPKIKRGVVELQSQRMFRKWKKRYFHLERGTVIYFEPLHWYQEGEFDLSGLEIATELKPTDDISVTIRLESPKYPDLCFKCHSPESKRRWIKAFRIHIEYANQMKAVTRTRGQNGTAVIENVTFDRGDELTISKIKDDEFHQPQKALMRKRTSTVTVTIVPVVDAEDGNGAVAVDQASIQEAASKYLEVIPIVKPVIDKGGVPVVHTGWLEKKGQWFPTIRRRFFVLLDGILSYYREAWDIIPFVQQVREEEKLDASSTQKKFISPRALGKFSIANYQFHADFEHGRVEITCYPSLASPSRRVLVLYCGDFMERDSWLRHLTAHSEYIQQSKR